MDEFTEPTQTRFNDVESSAIRIANRTSPLVLTKTGSVVRELVIRPFSYLLAWALDNIDKYITESSISYLKNSQLTENPVADAVASNYFVYRKQGTHSKGTVALLLNKSEQSIARGSLFSINDVQVRVPVRCFITNTDTTSSADTTTNDILQVRASTYTDPTDTSIKYVANIPVEAVDAGSINITAGAKAQPSFTQNYIVKAYLSSALTGGADKETDAKLIERAGYNTAYAGVGSYNGLLKKLSNAPVSVISLSVVAGENAELYRARNNSVNISPGGITDCYVKTTILPHRTNVTATKVTTNSSTGGASYAVTVNNGVILNVLSVDSGDTTGFTQHYTSADVTMSDAGARLSSKQLVAITKEQSDADVLDCVVEYIPGISDIQSFIDNEDERFIGHDICIKAAVPVSVSLSCAVSYNGTITEEELNKLKTVMADYINNLPVGTSLLNFSDIRTACSSVIKNATIVLPCVFTYTTTMKDGSTITGSSTNGILDISKNIYENEWPSTVCYFNITTDDIYLGEA